jgi:hypothetical protein
MTLGKPAKKLRGFFERLQPARLLSARVHLLGARRFLSGTSKVISGEIDLAD